MTCPHRYDVAAMVLNALQPQESARLHAHLAHCAGCRDLMAELGPLPLMLALVEPPEAATWRFSSPVRYEPRIPGREAPWSN